MKFKIIVLILFSIFLVSCKANEEKIIDNSTNNVKKTDILSGKYLMIFAGAEATVEADVIKEYLYVKKEAERWILANDFNNETVEMTLLRDVELKVIGEGLLNANNLECLKTLSAVFCSVDKNAKIKKGNQALKTGYFLMILDAEHNENNVGGLVELEKQ